MTRCLGVLVSALIVVAVAATAEAQSVVVEGQVTVQPNGYNQPPPGYGQQQVYVQQPYYQQQPTYVQQVPQRRVQYVDQETSIAGLWIPGIIVFGVSWVLTGTFAISLSYNVDYYNYAWIPLIGPGLMLSVPDINDDEIAGAVIGGVGQLAGLTMFILGLVLRQTERVAVYTLDEHNPRSSTIALGASPGGMGLSFNHF